MVDRRGVITQRYLERDGERLLLRFAVNDVAVLDILAAVATMARARAAVEHIPERGSFEQHLGTFGPFAVTMSGSADTGVAIAVDGPNLGDAFAGDKPLCSI